MCFIVLHFRAQRFVDINECEKGTNRCQQECVNTDGGYTCECKRGYEKINGGFQCKRK